jgi:hypothetical protein
VRSETVVSSRGFRQRAFYVLHYIYFGDLFDDRKRVSVSEGREPTSETILLRLHNF